MKIVVEAGPTPGTPVESPWWLRMRLRMRPRIGLRMRPRGGPGLGRRWSKQASSPAAAGERGCKYIKTNLKKVIKSQKNPSKIQRHAAFKMNNKCMQVRILSFCHHWGGGSANIHPIDGNQMIPKCVGNPPASACRRDAHGCVRHLAAPAKRPYPSPPGQPTHQRPHPHDCQFLSKFATGNKHPQNVNECQTDLQRLPQATFEGQFHF